MLNGISVLNKRCFSNPEELLRVLNSINNKSLVLMFIRNESKDYSEDLIAYPYFQRANDIDPIELSDIKIHTGYYSEEAANGIEICSPYLTKELDISEFVKSKYGVLSLKCMLLGACSSDRDCFLPMPLMIEGNVMSENKSIGKESFNEYCFVVKVKNEKLRVYKMSLDPLLDMYAKRVNEWKESFGK